MLRYDEIAPTGRHIIAYGFNHRYKMSDNVIEPCRGDITLNMRSYNDMSPLQGCICGTACVNPMVKTIGYYMSPLQGVFTLVGNVMTIMDERNK